MIPVRKKTKVEGEWLSLGEAARLLGDSRQTVLMRAVKGEVHAEHVAGRTVVSRKSVESFIRARR